MFTPASSRFRRCTRRILLCGLLGISRLLAAGSDEPLAAGRKIFEVHCAPCHGPHGEGGRGPTLAQPILPRASDEESLLRIIRDGISGTEMPRSRMRPAEIPLVAAYVRSLGQLPPEKIPGDPVRGAELYRTRGGCAQCHVLQGRGGVIGPDLSAIGRRRSLAYLQRALVDPGAEVPVSFSAFRADTGLPENFLLVRVVTRSGEDLTGVRANEDAFSIQLRDLGGGIHSYLKSELTELQKLWGVSPMPSYRDAFSPAELDDLVAFLSSLRSDK